jgi:RNA polymerase sigma-70 factor (ECF subfamily)
VTRHAVVDHYRRRRPAEPLPEELAGTAAGAGEVAEQELARCLTPLLAGLPAPYRDALTLAEVEGLAQREIARREGISLSGAKSRVQRARRMLRQAILGCCRVEVDRRGGVLDFQRQAGCEPDGGPQHGDRPCAPSGDGPGCRVEP